MSSRMLLKRSREDADDSLAAFLQLIEIAGRSWRDGCVPLKTKAEATATRRRTNLLKQIHSQTSKPQGKPPEGAETSLARVLPFPS
ncbi:hypothetical protein CEXT_187251 [Caerostris extrusa]|uniref:Uncharacterized protein n=1 Tax=Caerostris extrusa TaxID=172846 RepID=A0AAV4VTK0_CAEEX|nr:hypothetical protein CEXT_187251 [Caerostris extrusa]